MQTGTTTELNLADHFRTNKMKYETVGSVTTDEDASRATMRPLQRVHAPTSRSSSRSGLRLAKPDDHVILPDVISKEPLGPVVRQGDAQWLNIVKWVHFAMINAEELGVNSKNIDDA